MKRIGMIALAVLCLAMAASAAVAFFGQKTQDKFYSGHWHDEYGGTHNAPQHGEGMDINGCHGGTVAYHCH
jgi:hypothetical protein